MKKKQAPEAPTLPLAAPVIDVEGKSYAHLHSFQPVPGIMQGSNGIFVLYCTCGIVREVLAKEVGIP